MKGVNLPAMKAPDAVPSTERVAPKPAPSILSNDAMRARLRPRHYVTIISFVLLFLLPTIVWNAYLYLRAADQYHSIVAFTVRSEEMQTSLDLFEVFAGGGVTDGASDTDVLFEFIQSQQLVEKLDRDLDLRTIYNKAEGDPIFALGEATSIEDLVDYWPWMVDISYDSGIGLIEVTAKAFTPEDANAIATAILEESTLLINRLSEAAREDAIRFAALDLEEAEQRLRDIRREVSVFRNQNQIVDPSGDVEMEQGVISVMEQELAQALITLAELRDFAPPGDPRIVTAERRVRAIEAQIAAERSDLGAGGAAPAGDQLSMVIGRFEELLVDREFAEQSYVAAQAAHDTARAEARRQTRYLAPYVEPTVSQAPQYPQRLLLGSLGAMFLLIGWGIVVLVAYNVRDRA